MARRPGSGRGWTDDGSATGKSFRHPLEAWWKHEGENRCAIPRIRAQAAPVGPPRNWRKPRSKSRSCAIVHGLFDATHNLKAAGSNPAPATKTSNTIRYLCSALRGAFCIRAFTSTPHQHHIRKAAPARTSGHQQATDQEFPNSSTHGSAFGVRMVVL